jgi:nitronate monooxygenase
MNSLLKFPVIIAPMAGGPNTVLQNVIAAKQGVLGSFGFAYSSPAKIDEDLSAMKRELNEEMVYVNANFFIFAKQVKVPSREVFEKTVESLKPFGLEDASMPTSPFYPDLDMQLESVWKNKPRVLTFHFGHPSDQVINRAKSLGMLVGCSCTNVRDAKTLTELPIDFIILQGIEAGGHRGTFESDEWNPDVTCTSMTTTSNDDQLSALELLKRVKEITGLPLVVAGGFMTGKHIKEAIELGATAVQMGTAFLTCEESGTSTLYKETLLKHSTEDKIKEKSTEDKVKEQPKTLTYTRHFSGRPAQGLDNTFTLTLTKTNSAFLPFPLQNTLTGPIRAAAVKQGDVSRQSFWAGWGHSQVRRVTTNDFLNDLRREY